MKLTVPLQKLHTPSKMMTWGFSVVFLKGYQVLAKAVSCCGGITLAADFFTLTVSLFL